MSDESLQPIPEEAETTAESFRDPEGPDPESIPDPMPDELKSTAADTAFEDADPMSGEAPTS